MYKFKRVCVFIAVVVCLALVLSACGSSAPAPREEAKEAPKAESAKSSDAAQKSSGEKTKFKFYGKVNEYSSFDAMTKALAEKLKDKYDFEFIPVDWGNLEKVIRTGIASGDPCDLYEYWPPQMKTFIDSKMALDLTPYLEENGGEWKNTFIQTALDTGKYGDKYYAVPYDVNFSVLYVNKDVLDKAGVTIPDKWNWSEFLAACKQIKGKTGVTPVGFPIFDMGGLLLENGVESILKSDPAKLDAFATGKTDVTTLAPEFKTAFKNIKDLFANGYIYPEKGAVTAKRDELKAGLQQGKVAMVAEVAALAKTITKDLPFNYAIAPWPTMGNEGLSVGGGDGFFVPASAKDPKASVEVLKAFYSKDIMKIHADHGFAVTFNGIEITDPITKDIVKFSKDLYTKEFHSIDPKMNEYITKNFMGELIIANKNEDELIKKIEEIRKSVKQ